MDAGESARDGGRCARPEETGSPCAISNRSELFHVDVHPGPRGHTHYDLRYVLVAPPEDPDAARGRES